MQKEYKLDNGKIISQGEYLYGDDAEPPEIPQEVIMRRIELLQDNLEILLNHSYHTRDGMRVSAILKAIRFWETINNH